MSILIKKTCNSSLCETANTQTATGSKLSSSHTHIERAKILWPLINAFD